MIFTLVWQEIAGNPQNALHLLKNSFSLTVNTMVCFKKVLLLVYFKKVLLLFIIN